MLSNLNAELVSNDSSSFVHFEASPYKESEISEESEIIPKTLITETQNISGIDYSLKFDKSVNETPSPSICESAIMMTKNKGFQSPFSNLQALQNTDALTELKSKVKTIFSHTPYESEIFAENSSVKEESPFGSWIEVQEFRVESDWPFDYMSMHWPDTGKVKVF